MTHENTYTIQEVANETDLTTYTLRYYEDIGLLDPIQRATNGHRRYSETDVRRIEMLKKLRRTGMSIEEMKQFISLYREGSITATKRRELLEAHRESVDAQIAELYEIRAFIDMKIGMYQDEEKTLNERHEISTTG